MMDQLPPPPSLEKVKQWAAKMEEINQRWDALIVIADYMIAELEADLAKQKVPRSKLKKAAEFLNIELPNMEEREIC